MKKKIAFLVIFILFLVMEYQVIALGSGFDDAIFLEKLNSNGIINFVQDLYLNWSGRVFITLVATLFLKQVLLFKILNALVFTYLVYKMSQLFKLNKISSSFLLAIILMSLNLSTLSSSTLWIIGSLNYLWPTTALISILVYLKKEKFTYLATFEFVIASLFAFNQEQTAAIALVIIVIALIKSIILKQKLIKPLTSLIVGLILTIILFAAPGNYLRATSELVRWYPQYGMFSVMDKFMAGVFLLNRFIMKQFTLVIFLISFMIAFSNNTKLAKIPFIYLIFRFLLGQLAKFNILNSLYHLLFDFNYFQLNYYLDWKLFISNILAIIVILMIAFYLIGFVEDNLKLDGHTPLEVKWGSLEFTLLYFAAITSVLVIGFSPTFIGSGSRIYFITAVVFSAIVSYLVDRGYLYYKIIIWIFIILALMNFKIVLQDHQFLYQYF